MLFRSEPIGTHTMSISLTGRNQVYSIARGVTGHYIGSFPISLLTDTIREIGPSMYSDSRIGWHNDDELVLPSDLDGAIDNNNPSFTRNYLGLRFEREGALHYSWMSISARDTYDGTEVYIHAWAWESEPGKSILVAAIPEPDVAWLALAGVSLGLRRKRMG